ncbi:thioesterase domain-containing protein [Thiotrichales bacterium HSG14]|nr:thioesterase domain-containing protein [Thiotrichales bacterium HSG14]
MAGQYIQEICTVQTKFPYYLCSYCADAKIAIEIAQQLITQGKEIKTLIFIDVIWDQSSKQLQNRLNYLRHNLLEFGPSYLS